MKLNRLITVLMALMILAACVGQPAAGATPSPTAPLPSPVVRVTDAPDPHSAMGIFLDAWQKDDFAGMYALLSKDSQAAISQDDFVTRYRSSMAALTLKQLSYQISANDYTASSAQLSFQVTFKTRMVGDLQRDMTAQLTLENGQWRIVWNDGLILPELLGGSHLQMDFSVPPRGIIFDRNNQPLVTQTDAMAIGVIPNQINPGSEPLLVSELSQLTGLFPGEIVSKYDDKRSVDWYVAIGEAALQEFNGHFGSLSGLGGAVWSQYNSRYYFQGGIAPQAVGYVSPVPREQVDEYVRNGYSQAASIGAKGIEKWGEQYLAGKTGGTLYVVDKDGKVVSELGKSVSSPSSSITLTIDRDLQLQAQKAMVGFRGSIVVLERNTGHVLAMVSSPQYDPNLFDPNNANSGYALGNLVNDPENPLYNRATQGQYPLGSVFKVITFSAALESGTYTPETPYDCGYDFTELSDRTLHDWTWDHYQKELANGDTAFTQPSGHLDLTGALMRSCNPYFWHIGVDLFKQGRVSAIADMARGFGLSKITGIVGMDELPGTIVNPPGLLDATNQAIGQGDVLVTPLQVANFMAAIGNGGSLYRPQIISKITDANGVETSMLKSETIGILPMKPETIAALRNAMLQVIRNSRGTAYQRFYNLKAISIYGKTGTAESNTGIPHAWFAGYTDQQNPDKPDIAIAVIAENAGEGSVVAAPMFKRIVEIYFYGQPRSFYPWESNIGITRTPTEPVTPTLAP